MKKKILVAAIFGLSLNLISCTTDNYVGQPKPNYAAASDTNIRIGMELLKKGDPEAAKESLLRAISQAPNSPESWYAMAYYYEFTGNSALAEQDYRKALALAPRANAGAARNNYGAFLCREKHYHAGIKQILMAAQSSNYLNTAEAYENAGVCASRIPDYKSAIVYFQKALENDPNRRGALISLAKIYSKMGNKKMARYYVARFQKARGLK